MAAATSEADVLYDVFLSYSREDRADVKTLARRLLDTEGIKVWLDEWNLVPGAPWQPEIEKALYRCRSVAILIGPAGVSPWQNEEMRTALQRRVQQTNGLFRLIPVLLPGTKPDMLNGLHFLSSTTWVEFGETLDNEWAIHCLVCGIRGLAPGPEFLAQEAGHRQRLFFVIDGTVDDVDQNRLEALVASLKRYAGDANLTLKEVRKGSVRLLLEGSKLAIERLKFLVETKQLRELAGLPVRSVESPTEQVYHADPSVTDDHGGSEPTASVPAVLYVSRHMEEGNRLQAVLLSMSIAVEQVPSIAAMRARLSTRPYDVIVTEDKLSDGSWTLVLSIAQELKAPPQVIVATRYADESMWAELLNAGGYDLLIRPFNDIEVKRTLYGALRVNAIRK